MTSQHIREIAENHGIQLADEIRYNEMGIDFKVAFATDLLGQQWVLRIPRRPGLEKQMEDEKRILSLVRKHLSVQVPDWQIATQNLIAYKLLTDKPALTFDAETYEVTWNIDQHSPNYLPSLAKTLVQLHNISKIDALDNQIKTQQPEDIRLEISSRLELVKSELGVSEALEYRYLKWLDNDALWPNFTKFIHGDLYAGHILTTPEGVVTGIIDWTTGHVGDPALDFSGHFNVFGEESLKQLIATYEKEGGHVWDKMYEQVVERAAATALVYGFFALETQDEKHIAGAKAMLGVA